MSPVRRGANHQEINRLLRDTDAAGGELTSIKPAIILRRTMMKHGFILLLAAILFGLPLASISARAGGCCGPTSEQSGSGAHHADGNTAHNKCCCGDASTCTCHLAEDDTVPIPDAVPVSSYTDQRTGLTQFIAATPESVIPHTNFTPSLVRSASARAPSPDIYVLNHNFIC